MSIDERISEALRRLVAGMGAMRIPADPCDADLVLSDVQTELASLRAQLEAVTRERDVERNTAAMHQAIREETLKANQNLARERDEAKHHVSQVREGEAHLKRDLEVARIYAADREGLALQLDAARETIQYGIELRQKAVRERDEARESEARMRAVLERVRDAMRATGQEPDGDDDPRRPLATAVWAALSAPAPEPSERMMRVAEAVAAEYERKLDMTGAGGLDIDLRAIVAKVTP